MGNEIIAIIQTTWNYGHKAEGKHMYKNSSEQNTMFSDNMCTIYTISIVNLGTIQS